MALEVGVAMLAAQRADRQALDALAALVDAMDEQLGTIPSYRHSDVRFHVGSPRAPGARG